MKTILFAVLDRGEKTDLLYQAIIKEGFNGTMIKTQGLRHILERQIYEKPAVLSLSQIAENTHESGQNSTMFFIVEARDLLRLEDLIRQHTDDFKDIHGCMFVLPIQDFEGSF